MFTLGSQHTFLECVNECFGGIFGVEVQVDFICPVSSFVDSKKLG